MENSQKEKGACSVFGLRAHFSCFVVPPARDGRHGSQSALLFFGDFLAGDVAEYQKVGQGVAAEAIAAVDAARVSHAA